MGLLDWLDKASSVLPRQQREKVRIAFSTRSAGGNAARASITHALVKRIVGAYSGLDSSEHIVPVSPNAW